MLKLKIKVIPNSSSCRFKLDEGLGILKCYVTAPAVDGKANKMLIKKLAKILKLTQSDIKIKSGITSRIKDIEIDIDLTMNELLRVLIG